MQSFPCSILKCKLRHQAWAIYHQQLETPLISWGKRSTEVDLCKEEICPLGWLVHISNSCGNHGCCVLQAKKKKSWVLPTESSKASIYEGVLLPMACVTYIHAMARLVLEDMRFVRTSAANQTSLSGTFLLFQQDNTKSHSASLRVKVQDLSSAENMWGIIRQ